MTAQGFQSLLQAAVQCGLSSSLGVQEEEAGYRLDEDFLPQADVAGKFSANDAWRTRQQQGAKTNLRLLFSCDRTKKSGATVILCVPSSAVVLNWWSLTAHIISPHHQRANLFYKNENASRRSVMSSHYIMGVIELNVLLKKGPKISL